MIRWAISGFWLSDQLCRRFRFVFALKRGGVCLKEFGGRTRKSKGGSTKRTVQHHKFEYGQFPLFQNCSAFSWEPFLRQFIDKV